MIYKLTSMYKDKVFLLLSSKRIDRPHKKTSLRSEIQVSRGLIIIAQGSWHLAMSSTTHNRRRYLQNRHLLELSVLTYDKKKAGLEHRAT